MTTIYRKSQYKGQREKVVIIGGGLGAITAAYGLTAPEQNGKYDVTIHTMGWRLGGKGASGRNAHIADRIEEHGLHIWFGCYDNAFTMMKNIYDELDRPPDAPLATLDTAFRGLDHFVLEEKIGDEWRSWQINFPSNDLQPGGRPSLWAFLEIIMAWIKRAAKSFGHHPSVKRDSLFDDLEAHLHAPEHRASPLDKLSYDSSRLHLGDLVESLHEHISDKAKSGHKPPPLWAKAMAKGIQLLAEGIWWAVQDKMDVDDVRQLWIMTNLGTTISRGILLDNLMHNGVDSIDGVEGRAWLYKHASLADDAAGDPNGLAFTHGPIQALYDACFAYPKGDTDNPDFSAATLLRACLWLPFSYKGHFCFEMQAGMGDTVFVPAYEALLSRGVKFNFFSMATDMKADATGENIESVTLSQQVNLEGGYYDPLVNVNGLPCWPSTPDFDQIVEGDALRDRKINLEHYTSGWQNCGPENQLMAGQDFDHVIFTVPLPAHNHVCPDLVAASPAWKKAATAVKATRTLAAQFWFNVSRQELGVRTPAVVTGTFVEPWASLADFTHLLPRESWGNRSVNYLNYTCGVLPDTAGDTQAKANEYVFESARDYIRDHSQPLWPRAHDRGDIKGFNWNALVAEEGVRGEDRLRAQYLRANIDPNELYILSTHGGINNRPKTQAAGIKNLFFAGDWTNNGFNISSVEGAVMSGLQASRALSGWPKDIVGEDPGSLSPSG